MIVTVNREYIEFIDNQLNRNGNNCNLPEGGRRFFERTSHWYGICNYDEFKSMLSTIDWEMKQGYLVSVSYTAAPSSKVRLKGWLKRAGIKQEDELVLLDMEF